MPWLSSITIAIAFLFAVRSLPSCYATDTDRRVHTTTCRSCQELDSLIDLRQQTSGSELLSALDGQLGRFLLTPKNPRVNPYGARYSMNAEGQIMGLPLAGLPQRELAQGSVGAKEKRRKERRKALNRKAKLNAQDVAMDELHPIREQDSSQPIFFDQQQDPFQAEPGGFDSNAVQDHVASDFPQDRNNTQGNPHGGGKNGTAAAAGEGQLGISGWEAAGGVDSSGVSEHFTEDPALLEGQPRALDRRVDASGAQMPHQARAAGVDSGGVAGHIAEDVGQDLIDKSGSTEELSTRHLYPRDASDREVVVVVGADETDSTRFNQAVITEAAEDAVADARDNGETDISAAGVMPASWAATTVQERLDSEDQRDEMDPS